MFQLPNYGFEALCALVDLPQRTVRYYIQIGLVDRPDGQGRGAKYGPRHVEQLLNIKKWQVAGLSLERIRELLHGGIETYPERRVIPGTVEAWSRLFVAPGIELHVEAGTSGLTPEALRSFFRKVMDAYQDTQSSSDK